MKTYVRNARFWFAVRHAFALRAQLWSKGGEARALLQIAQSEDWLDIFTDRAPASRYLSPEDVAQVLIYKLLLP
jgi:hypothetical protein